MSTFESAPSPSGIGADVLYGWFLRTSSRLKAISDLHFGDFCHKHIINVPSQPSNPFSVTSALYSCSPSVHPSCCICKTKLIPQRLIHLGSKCCPNICSFKKDNTQEKLMYMDGLEIGFLVDCQFTHVGILVEC